jgi:hypothetical protein
MKCPGWVGFLPNDNAASRFVRNYFVSPRMSSIRDLACLIATARLTGVIPAFKSDFHRQPIPSSN